MFGRVLDTPSYGEGNCIFKINNRNSKARCEICLKLTMKTPKRIRDDSNVQHFDGLHEIMCAFDRV